MYRERVATQIDTTFKTSLLYIRPWVIGDMAFEEGSPSYTSMNITQIISMLGHTDLQNQQCCYGRRSNKIEVCENELAKCFWQSRWLDHQLGWVGLPTFLAPLSALNPPKTNISPSNKLKMYVISLAIQPLAGGRVWDFFSIWRRLKVNIYHRAAPLPSFDFHSRLSSYASYTEIRVCFLFKVSRDCFRTPRHVVTLCWKCGNFTAL